VQSSLNRVSSQLQRLSGKVHERCADGLLSFNASPWVSGRRLKRAHTHRWTKADNAAWWAARRATLKARGSPTRESCVDGVKLFERFYCGK
jgi:hypothetical protein